MKRVFVLFGVLLYAQGGGYNPYEVIGEDDGSETTPLAPSVVRGEEITIRVNGQPFEWADPLVIGGGKTYTIHITGLKPRSKLILRLFKAGQSAGAAHFNANEVGELELEATLDKRRFQGTAEVIYYPSNGKEVRRRFKVKVQ